MKSHAFIDAHSHLADARIFSRAGDLISEAEKEGISFFMQGGVDPDDWYRQLDLLQAFPKKIGLCFGLHPYFVAAHEESICEKELDLLAQMIHQALALGETGLDFRPHIMKDSKLRQIHIFEQQLELAEIAQKPVVLHLVQAHDEALRVFDMFGLPRKKGLVHSFNGSWGQAKDFLQRGLLLSVGGPICRPDNQRLRQAVKEIPLESLLIETDSPDQPPPQIKENHPVTLWLVAKAVAEIKGLTPVEVMKISTSNFCRLFQI